MNHNNKRTANRKRMRSLAKKAGIISALFPVGTEVEYSDRTYIVHPDGSLRVKQYANHHASQRNK